MFIKNLKSKIQQAFTFLETLAAIAVLEVILVSGLTMFAFNHRAMSLAEDNITAMYLLQEKVEEIKCLDFTKDVTAVNYFYADFPRFVMNVAQVTNYVGNPYLKKITVDCQWVTAFNSTKHQQIVFLVNQ